MQFPPLFAVSGANGLRGRVSVFQSTLIRDGPDRWGESPSIYHISPYRIFHGIRDHQYSDEAFILPARSPNLRETPPRHDVMLVADLPPRYYNGYEDPLPIRRVFYQGRWDHTGATVFSMYCASPIPVLEFPSNSSEWGAVGPLIQWPAAYYNRLPVSPVDHEFVRFWQQRWIPPSRRVGDPDVWRTEHDESSESVDSPVPRLFPPSPPLTLTPSLAPPLASTEPTPPPSAPLTHDVRGPSAIASDLPSFVANAIVQDAITRGLQCPITLEPIADISTPIAVTACYHVFESAAFHIWMNSGDGTCPVCKAHLTQ